MSHKVAALKPGQACLSCRRQKIVSYFRSLVAPLNLDFTLSSFCAHRQRCSAEKPRCSNCVTSDRQCEYRAPSSISRRLEERLALLESQVADFESTQAPPIPDLDPTGRVLRHSTLAIPRVECLESWNPEYDMPIELRRELYAHPILQTVEHVD